MVQVDIFWSFAIGAGFAASAAKQLEKEEKPFESKAFIKNLLWLSIFFVPSGATLLWGFPAWETMQVGTYENIPAWLVALFCGTNITQGILGFWVTYRLIRARKIYAANLMWMLGYFCMFFILVHGWDGTGYQRFLYSAKDWSGNYVPWTPGSYSIRWVYSPVAVTLYVMGVIMMPFLFRWMFALMKEDYELIRAEEPEVESPIRLRPNIGLLVFGYTLGPVIVASLLIHWLGWIFGSGIFVVIAYFALIRRGGLVHAEISKFAPEYAK
ncbi:MAG: hypothetical protein JSU92_13025 [Deltaproteobacteria bacterium]|nr:MAG: hypothetical protein JSU92_13025 [Deltaproteobacteria bacterium]